MGRWSEVFVDENVQAQSRRSARRLTASFAATAAVMIGVAPLAAVAAPEYAVASAFVGLALMSSLGAWVVHRVHPVQRRTWHVELSIREAVFVDVQGRRRAVRWSAVESVNLSEEGITFATRDAGGLHMEFQVPAEFQRYAALSHRAVEYAEATRRPVLVDGIPWQSVDVLDLFPFLSRATS